MFFLLAPRFKPIFILVFIFSYLSGLVQEVTAQKIIHQNTHSWISLNTTGRLTNKWGFNLDLHERRNHFLADNSFHFIRAGVVYWINDQLTAGVAYGHLWLAPVNEHDYRWANENRIHEQIQLHLKFKKVDLLQRWRMEQRWQQKIISGMVSGTRFTHRFRYMLSFTYHPWAKSHVPSFILSDEIMVQSGREVTFNTFDQNRLFIGIKQNIGKNLFADTGYMLVTQQKSSGNVYDFNNTFRLFFYYQIDGRKIKHHSI